MRKTVIQQIMLMGIVGMFTMLSVLAACLALERQLERDAKENQERIALK